MRQLTCSAPNTIGWQDVPAPRLQGDGEALVRPLSVARCDIDLFLTSGLFPSRGPFALGHEGVAEILELGDAVRGLEVGQRVVVAFQVSCGTCGSCPLPLPGKKPRSTSSNCGWPCHSNGAKTSTPPRSSCLGLSSRYSRSTR